MFSNIELYYVLGPAIIIAAIVLVTFNKRIKKRGGTELSKAIERFKITSIVFGGILLLLLFTLPSTYVLQTFGFPKNLSTIKNDAEVLALFQTYNKAIVRTTEVLYWFIFSFVVWFLTTLNGVFKALANSEKVEGASE